ncbi:pre-mRNA-splicing factor CWC2, putative [Plasmodium vinckei vinckei]|uniref:Pre-mRNA-splicing factor CWC2, putative n=1 Tax=Plasmodium vinckei vinckei TaxID=54757 RepID=A0A449BV48_PLAVN|nr:pre-mRNA-splicing factor CWC2, putative [Plasmodium vinckei vinckei]VEV57273.1 pre-mRNA-splicing factor CWC2, putative [Plasmodium vinckei vinckei]
MGFKSFFNYKEEEKEKQADSSNTEKGEETGEENRDNNDSEKTSKDEVGPNKIDDKANENDKDAENDEGQNESSSKGSPRKRNGQGKRKKNNETSKEDNKVEEDSNKKGLKKRAKCNTPIKEDAKENDNNKDESVKEEASCNDGTNDDTNDGGLKSGEKDAMNESEKTNAQDKNQTVSNTTGATENNNINLENYRNYQYYYNQYYGSMNNIQAMGNDMGSGYNSNISKDNFQNKQNNLNNNMNTYPEYNNFNNMYMPIGMNNYYNMYNYNYINGYANIGNTVGVNNYNYNYYYGGNVENNGMYDYNKDLVSSGGGDMKNYAFLSLINRSLELMKTSDKVKEILKSPARLQVTQEELNKVEHTQDNQNNNNSNNNNVWFGKYVTDKNNNNNPKFVAKYKCNPSKDSGYTKADKSYANKPYFCIYFARGCCAYGHNCLYRHRVPTENDELEFENTMDIFGREKYNTFKEDMSGNGNFNNDCRTLFIGSIYINNFNEVSAIEKALYDEFVIYGNIDYVRFIPNKNIAFIQFTNRVNAEFARVAMSDQPLGNYSISLTIKWAFDMKPQPAGNPTNYYNGMNNANPYFYNPNQAMSSTWPQYMSQNPYGTSSSANYYDQANNLASPTIGPANFPPNFPASKGKPAIGPAPAAPAVPAAPAHPPPSNNNDAQNGKKKK